MDKKIKLLINKFGISSDIQLNDLAKQLDIKLHYIGFAESLPNQAKNGAYIINLGNFDVGGTHWTALYIKDSEAFYFDSYAGASEDEVISWLEKNGIKTLIYNDYFQMQRLEETLCGIYVIVFLYYMTYSKKKKLIERFQEFTKSFNDLDGDYSSGSILN